MIWRLPQADSTVVIRRWLKRLPRVDELFVASPARFYEHDESGYDEQYGNDHLDDQRTSILPHQLELLCSLHKPRVVLELACGPGTLTLGLVRSFPEALVVAADASPAFLKILASKLRRLNWSAESWPVLLQLCDNELISLPSETCDLICVRSGLHHFTDWRLRLLQLSRILAPGGVLALYEPRAEFFITAALLLDLLWARLDSHRQQVDIASFIHLFHQTSSFYIMQGADKAMAEDKHAFFLEDLIQVAADSGLILRPIGAEGVHPFSSTLRDYLRFCMQAPPVILSLIDELLTDEINRLDQMYASRLSSYGAAEWFLLSRPNN